MQLKWSIRVLFALLMFFLHDVAAAQTLKIPYVSISGFQAPLYLGERAGLFKKNQLEAQLIYMPGGSLIVQTLLSNEVGVASLAPPSAVAAWVKGAELSLVAGGIERALNVLMVNPKIKKVEDLKGKRVAISRFGSLSDVSLRDALAFHKLRANQDVVVAQIGGLGERMVALTSGVVDGAILNVDQVFQAEKLGFQILIDLRKLPLTYSTQGIVVSNNFLRCSSNVIMTGANGNVIMSGWQDDNPDNARREATRVNTTSISKRADRGSSRTGDGSQRTAVLPGQSTGR